MFSTSPHKFEEHSEATSDKIKSEMHDDTDLVTVCYDNKIKPVHLSSASGAE